MEVGYEDKKPTSMSSLSLVLILSKGGIRSSLETGATILIFQKAWTIIQLFPEATSSRKPALMPPPKSENPSSVLYAQHSFPGPYSHRNVYNRRAGLYMRSAGLPLLGHSIIN